MSFQRTKINSIYGPLDAYLLTNCLHKIESLTPPAPFFICPEVFDFELSEGHIFRVASASCLAKSVLWCSNSSLYSSTGAFLAISSNTRYQIINGLERVVEASPLAKNIPPVAMAFTVGVRFANNVYGGMQFVDWARWSGVQ